MIKTENEYPIKNGDHDSIINSLSSISSVEIYNSYLKLEEKGYIRLSNRLGKASELIESVISDLTDKKIDFRIGV